MTYNLVRIIQIKLLVHWTIYVVTSLQVFQLALGAWHYTVHNVIASAINCQSACAYVVLIRARCVHDSSQSVTRERKL